MQFVKLNKAHVSFASVGLNTKKLIMNGLVIFVNLIVLSFSLTLK